MKYSKDERLEIGRRIYIHEISAADAAIEYNINWYTARDYMRLYRDTNNLPPNTDGSEQLEVINNQRKKYEDLEALSHDQLIDEVIKARVEVERAKKGYAVQEGGLEKEFISLNNSNSK